MKLATDIHHVNEDCWKGFNWSKLVCTNVWPVSAIAAEA